MLQSPLGTADVFTYWLGPDKGWTKSKHSPKKGQAIVGEMGRVESIRPCLWAVTLLSVPSHAKGMKAPVLCGVSL